MFDLRLPYYVYPDSRPILLFLHGVGEGFNPLKKPKPGEIPNLERIRHKNLYQQGPPKYLNPQSADVKRLEPNHPLHRAFTVVAPQLPDRDMSWLDARHDVKRIVAAHRPPDGKLYVVGFSKGGFGAFLLAPHLNANAIVTIDASPMETPAETAKNQSLAAVGQIPFWAIYTKYENPERLERVYSFNELLTENKHEGFINEPPSPSQSRTLVTPPEKKSETDRHGWICDQVTESTAPFEWLLKH